jgi:pimeloyl-ACP methyl ester carboxylesterase
VPGAALATVADAGHMLHHDQPARVASVIEPFLAAD